MPTPLNQLDLLALSELAWDIADPAGDHETQEQTWTASLHDEGPVVETPEELHTLLSTRVPWWR